MLHSTLCFQAPIKPLEFLKFLKLMQLVFANEVEMLIFNIVSRAIKHTKIFDMQ